MEHSIGIYMLKFTKRAEELGTQEELLKERRDTGPHSYKPPHGMSRGLCCTSSNITNIFHNQYIYISYWDPLFSKNNMQSALRNIHRVTQKWERQKNSTENKSPGDRSLGKFPLEKSKSENISTF